MQFTWQGTANPPQEVNCAKCASSCAECKPKTCEPSLLHLHLIPTMARRFQNSSIDGPCLDGNTCCTYLNGCSYPNNHQIWKLEKNTNSSLTGGPWYQFRNQADWTKCMSLNQSIDKIENTNCSDNLSSIPPGNLWQVIPHTGGAPGSPSPGFMVIKNYTNPSYSGKPSDFNCVDGGNGKIYPGTCSNIHQNKQWLFAQVV